MRAMWAVKVEMKVYVNEVVACFMLIPTNIINYHITENISTYVQTKYYVVAGVFVSHAAVFANSKTIKSVN